MTETEEWKLYAPWGEPSPISVDLRNAYAIYGHGNPASSVAFARDLETAALIAKAVNNHAALTAELAAVKKERDQFKAICECVLEELDETGVDEMSSEWCAIQNEITGALAHSQERA